ncbi:MAG: hypothetical protein IJ673_00245 [Treponema sp.]|nr:hypothetical protein [Treponema sp.]
MNETSAVLLAVSSELAALAKDGLPEMKEGETMRREWLENGMYIRETVVDGEVKQARYDFRQRKTATRRQK